MTRQEADRLVKRLVGRRLISDASEVAEVIRAFAEEDS